MTKRTSERRLSMMSLRESWGFSAGSIPERERTGSNSSRMRPLGSAMVSEVMIQEWTSESPFYRTGDARFRRGALLPAAFAQSADPRSQGGKLGLDFLVAAVEMVDAIDRGLAFGHQAGDDETGRSAQIGRHHGCA